MEVQSTQVNLKSFLNCENKDTPNLYAWLAQYIYINKYYKYYFTW